ncbi:MAG: hypothetical protein JEZ00_19435 [Anaerolineaceae bacterium]|nr:hypothetical protein [Anaerolineaceae bacterium]
MNKKRLLAGAISGALMGVICLIGASQRAGGWAGNEWMLFGLWFNRLLLGLIIGSIFVPNIVKRFIVAVLWGLAMGLAWYVSSGMHDLAAFLITMLYGIIIESAASGYSRKT